MVNDQEPRYRLVDADGNVVGSLFAESDGTLKLQEGTSTNDNELSLSTDGAVGVNAIDYDGVTPDYFIADFQTAEETSDATITSTSFTTVLNTYGIVDLSRVPTGMELYGRFQIRMGNDTGGEDTVARPQFFDQTDAVDRALASLEVSVTGGFSTADSGWVDLSNTSLRGNVLRNSRIIGSVTGGTGTFNYDEWRLQFAAVSR